MNKPFLSMAMLAVILLAVACGDEVEVRKLFYDSDTEVFLEDGKMHPATTQFTDDEMHHRMCDRAWQTAYAFYYDNAKVGKRSEIPFAADNYYVFQSQGTAYLGVIQNYRERVDYTYTVTGRNVAMHSTNHSFTLRVVAIDDTLLVTDTPMAGQHIAGYDDATVQQRTVFTKIAVPLPPL
ncbi:MAG: hypothetical protein IJT30_09465 [Muribaculaceae bacterium]|nr:hypothetical protein [Muribaculaceae bacterium]